MSREDRPDRALTLYEGHVRCIMELDTPAEKLAALETVFAIAFPSDDTPYEPPEIPKDGSTLSAEDKARRLAYNIFSGLIKFHGKKGESRIKDKKKVFAGKMGAVTRWGESSIGDSSTDAMESTVMSDDSSGQSTVVPSQNQSRQPIIHTDDYSSMLPGWRYKYKKELTEEEKAAISDWDRKIPNAQALHDWIENNFFHNTRNIARTMEFAEFAYNQLAKTDRWISTKYNRPLKDIKLALHYIALSYQRQRTEVKCMEIEEQNKLREASMNLRDSEHSQDLADLERKRRRQAEKAAMEKILRGEL